ncbi:amidase [Salipiger sp. PrR007]|uniref:amidase n=1 Tax=Salipiger sp. PrR007 TaxID=2706884 RepID=UPI0013BA9279|nr:amidase [Salipiger sp. PrR007]NDW33084.1 amidase [Salipiger sp. PrR007]
METRSYVQLDAVRLAGDLRAGRLCGNAVLAAARRRMAEVDPGLQAICEHFDPPVRAEVASSEQPAGPLTDALAGVPMLIKDLHCAVAGRPTANGSGFPAAPAAQSSTVVDRYLHAGAVLLGRSHSPELGGTSGCESRHHRLSTRNPYAPDLSSGGSSGGAAVAVATGIVPIAHASDAGGSITIPAALCGLVGLKPSHGLVPLGPERIEGAGGMAAQNALTRTAADAALALAVAANRPDLATPAPLAGRPRIGLVLQAADGGATCDAIAGRLAALAERLAALGMDVAETRLPPITPELSEAERRVRLASLAATVAAMEQAAGLSALPGHFEPATWARIEAGRKVTGADVLSARETILAYRDRVLACFKTYDLLLSPALNAAAPHPGALSLMRPDHETGPRNRDYTCFARPWNLTGFPSLSLPLIRDPRNRPEGALFAAAPGSDALLLSLAAWAEASIGWQHDHLTTIYHPERKSSP